MRALPFSALLLAVSLGATACGGDSGTAAQDGQPTVAAAFYPYAWLLERIVGDDVQVLSLTPPGAEPHDAELAPRQVADLEGAALVVYSEGFQPAVDEAVGDRDDVLDVLTAVETRSADGDDGVDPHVWLDPTRLLEIAGAVAEQLAERLPEQRGQVEQGLQDLTADLQAVDDAYRAGLASCARRELVTAHDAFGYLAQAYDLRQIPVTGLSPEAEPTPRRLQEVAETAQQVGATTVFFEQNASDAVAEQVAREVGATTAVLDPLEVEPDDGDLLTGLRTNLETLRTALDCA